MPRFPLAALLMAGALLLGACGGGAGSSDAPDTLAVAPGPSADVQSLPDSAKLFLIEDLPIGSSYEEITQRFAGVSPLTPKGIGELSDASAPVEVFGREALLELHFERRTLYSYYYMMERIPCDEAADLYGRVGQSYAAQYGPAREEQAADGAYRTRTRYWEATGYDVVATLGDESGACRLAWGFQEK